LSRVTVTIRHGFGSATGFINNLQVVTTISYYTIAALYNLQSLHTKLFSLSPLVYTGFVSLLACSRVSAAIIS
jgi:hypothetical protein